MKKTILFTTMLLQSLLLTSCGPNIMDSNFFFTLASSSNDYRSQTYSLNGLSDGVSIDNGFNIMQAMYQNGKVQFKTQQTQGGIDVTPYLYIKDNYYYIDIVVGPYTFNRNNLSLTGPYKAESITSNYIDAKEFLENYKKSLENNSPLPPTDLKATHNTGNGLFFDIGQFDIQDMANNPGNYIEQIQNEYPPNDPILKPSPEEAKLLERAQTASTDEEKKDILFDYSLSNRMGYLTAKLGPANYFLVSFNINSLFEGQIKKASFNGQNYTTENGHSNNMMWIYSDASLPNIESIAQTEGQENHNIQKRETENEDDNVKKLLAVVTILQIFLSSSQDDNYTLDIFPQNSTYVTEASRFLTQVKFLINKYLSAESAEERDNILKDILNSVGQVLITSNNMEFNYRAPNNDANSSTGNVENPFDTLSQYFTFLREMRKHLLSVLDNPLHHNASPPPETPNELFKECDTSDGTINESNKCLSYLFDKLDLPVYYSGGVAEDLQVNYLNCPEPISIDTNNGEEGNILYKPGEPVNFKSKNSYNNVPIKPTIEIVDNHYKITFKIGKYIDDYGNVLTETLIGPVKITGLDTTVVTSSLTTQTISDNNAIMLVKGKSNFIKTLSNGIYAALSLINAFEGAGYHRDKNIQDLFTNATYSLTGSDNPLANKDFLTGFKITYLGGRFTENGLTNYDARGHYLEWTIQDIDLSSSNSTTRVKRAPGTNPVIDTVNLVYIGTLVDYIMFIIQSSLDTESPTYSEDIPLPLNREQEELSICQLRGMKTLIYNIITSPSITSEGTSDVYAIAKKLCDHFTTYRYSGLKKTPAEQTMITYVQRSIKYLRRYLKYLNKGIGSANNPPPTPFSFTMFPEYAPRLPQFPPQYSSGNHSQSAGNTTYQDPANPPPYPIQDSSSSPPPPYADEGCDNDDDLSHLGAAAALPQKSPNEHIHDDDYHDELKK